MKPNIGISEKNLEGVIKILSTLLADEYVLYTKARNYHWNVVGPQFNELHKFFQSIYEELNEHIDDIAERIRSLGGWSVATLSEFLQLTRLKEHPGEYPDARKMIENLLNDYEAVIRTLREDIVKVGDEYKDLGTADFLTELMEKHEKTAWMLRSFLS
ncbi:starvation-inducible DNA-binding protein [Candidatus Thermokryptus mobilis]|uniref:Starvation-inducible DNA-binding protein n=1 Tax=Candidatus Thermokryptus mobilis TaxID=1643428 RepID=A0A0S4N3N2_9BACT|nr:DNA starvation/stationary phase protection protein [Candidatus Thermokryptus mobilis]CUU05721.1 starvation-inducible DNA-binding protein [Candidatus Thermokryptus mobilis]